MSRDIRERCPETSHQRRRWDLNPREDCSFTALAGPRTSPAYATSPRSTARVPADPPWCQRLGLRRNQEHLAEYLAVGHLLLGGRCLVQAETGVDHRAHRA